jgi:hypothetical protein
MIKDEFQKAFNKEYPSWPYEMNVSHIDRAKRGIALWGARWMAERCAKELKSCDYNFADFRILELLKELQ